MECKFGQLDFVSSDLRLRGDIFIPKLLTNRAGVTMVSLAIIMLPFLAVAQTTYHDPQGRYDLQVPDGWQVTPDKGFDQIIVHKGALQAIVAVQKLDRESWMTPRQFVDTTVAEFKAQCPTFQERMSGSLSLAGSPGVYSLSTCSDTKSPAVAETSSALTSNSFLVGFTEIAPLQDYYANLPVLDGIRNSLQVTGVGGAVAASNSTEVQAKMELKKACIVGAFAQEDCARRMGILQGQEARLDKASPGEGTVSVYRDPTGRFSFQVPEGWSAKPEGNNGVLGVQLRSGSDWINIMPADPAASATEVVLNQEQEIATKSNSSRKGPFGHAGLIQIFGNGLELTYDHFNASSMQGEPIESYIGGVGDISGNGHNFLLLIASIGGQQKNKGGATFLSVVRTIHLSAP
jgi:hypothetical protein